MGNRMLKETICVSEDIDALDWFCEVFFYRLLVNVDDNGRMDARCAILKARLFPLRPDITTDRIADALALLAARGMLRRYEVDGRPYLQLERFGAHQKVRYIKAKYPAPDDCGDSPQISANCGEPLPEVETEAKTETEAETEAEAEAEAEAQAPRAPAGDLVQVTAAAAAMGMAVNPKDWAIAEGLLREYSLPWVLEALDRTASGTVRSWRYVRGILQNWQVAGGIDARSPPRAATRPHAVLAHAYTQREYTRGELAHLIETI